jgi:hypothetical protein
MMVVIGKIQNQIFHIKRDITSSNEGRTLFYIFMIREKIAIDTGIFKKLKLGLYIGSLDSDSIHFRVHLSF